jgi:hypothetical protein
LTRIPHLAMSSPSLPVHYRRFNTTAGRSAIFKRIGILHFVVHTYSFSLGIA